MNSGPKVSVIMGIYNCERTLAESIESILSQSYKNWELIMCDDASTDARSASRSSMPFITATASS